MDVDRVEEIIVIVLLVEVSGTAVAIMLLAHIPDIPPGKKLKTLIVLDNRRTWGKITQL